MPPETALGFTSATPQLDPVCPPGGAQKCSHSPDLSHTLLLLTPSSHPSPQALQPLAPLHACSPGQRVTVLKSYKWQKYWDKLPGWQDEEVLEVY